MEGDVVFTLGVDLMHVFAEPKILPLLLSREVFDHCRYVSQSSLSPDVEHFSLSTLEWSGDTPIDVPRHCPWLQPVLDYLLRIAAHVSLEALCAHIRTKRFGKLGQVKVPVLCLLEVDIRSLTQRAAGID